MGSPFQTFPSLNGWIFPIPNRCLIPSQPLLPLPPASRSPLHPLLPHQPQLQLFESSLLVPRSVTQFQPSAEDKIDKLILLLQSNTNSIGLVNGRLTDLLTQTNDQFNRQGEKIELLDSKLNSGIVSLNDQIETAFGYADARIDQSVSK